MSALIRPVIITLVLIVLGAHCAHAKTAPPRELQGIVRELSVLETDVSNKKWKEALADAEDIDGKFRKLLPGIKKNVPGDVATPFGSMMTNLKKSIQSKNADNCLSYQIGVQKLFLSVMEAYDYMIPPSLILTKLNLDEANEAAVKKEYANVAREMTEILSLYTKTSIDLRGRGVNNKDLAAFRTALINVYKSAKAKNANKTNSGLKKLDSIFKNYMKLYQ